MSLKFCLQNEIHRITKVPQDFNALLKSLQEVFACNLPNKFTVEYQDCEGDKIIIHNNEDYALAIETELSSNKKSLKIFVNDVASLDNVSFVTRESICLAQDQETQATQSDVKSFEILPDIIEAPEPLCSRKKSLSIIIPPAEPKAAGAPVIEVPNVELDSGIEVLGVQKKCVEIKEEQQPVELNSGVAVLEVQRASLEIKEQQNLVELNSGVKVLNVQKVSFVEECPAELNSGVKVLNVQKFAEVEERPAEVTSGIKVVSVRKILADKESPAELNSGVKVLDVKKTVSADQYPDEIDSGIRVVGVQKASFVNEMPAEPKSGVQVLSLQKTLATEHSPFEPNSGIKVLNVRKISPGCCNSIEESQVELNSAVTILSVEKGEGRKAKMVQKIARETLYQEIPNIALMIKELLEVNQNNHAVHSQVICNMCRAFPIVGDRYKCLVLNDYDLCEDCEKVANHPYPLIKIRDENQYAYVNAFFQSDVEDQQKKKNRKSKKNKKVQKYENELGALIDGLVDQIKGVSSEDDKFLAELIPTFTGVQGKYDNDIIEASVEELEPLLRNETQAFNPVDELNNLLCGFIKKLDENTISKEQEVINNKVVPCEAEVENNKYSADMVEKIEAFLEIFPESDLEEVCQVFSENPNKSVEDLVLDFIAAC